MTEAALTITTHTRAAPSTTVTDLTPQTSAGVPVGAVQARWIDELDDTGSFSVTLQSDDPAVGSIDLDQLVRFTVDATAEWQGVIERIRTVAVADDPADQQVTLTGRGAVVLCDEAAVYPSRGVGTLPVQEQRPFGFMSPEFDPSGWGTAKQIAAALATTEFWAAYPDGFPDLSAYWIWGDVVEATTLNAPDGVCLFRSDFTLGVDAAVRWFFAADNVADLYIDGQLVQSVDDFRRCREFEVTLSAGTHTAAIRGRNDPSLSLLPGEGNPAGVILSGWTAASDGTLDTVVLRTTSSWYCLAYPVTEPGFTPGRILRLLLEEAQDRGALTGVTLGFTDTLDSAGTAWDEVTDFAVDVGRSLLDVILEMSESLIDFRFSASGLVLDAWVQGGRGSTLALDFDLPASTEPSSGSLTELVQDRVR